jgi:hypothetical protein
MECLSLIRDCVRQRTPMRIDGAYVHLGDRRFPAAAKTIFKIASGGFYQLDALVFYLNNATLYEPSFIFQTLMITS